MKAILKQLDARDMLGLGGFVSLIYGIACLNGPAAWISGGVIALAAWITPVLLTRRTKH